MGYQRRVHGGRPAAGMLGVSRTLQALWAVTYVGVCLADIGQQQCAASGCFSTPPIVIGGWQLLERHADPSSAVATLMQYAEANFTTFDTADIYGPSEGILGQFRSSYAQKFGDDRAEEKLVFHTKYVTQDGSLRNARAVNHRSRQALGRVPQLVQFHWWDYSDKTYIGAAGHLATLRAEGFVGNLAACNFDTIHLQSLLDAQLPIVANQVQYSLLDRRPENGMIQLSKQSGVQLLCFGAVAGGWLSDKFLGAPAAANRLGDSATVSMRMYRRALQHWSRGSWGLFQQLLRAMRDIADAHDTSVAAVAMAWVLTKLRDDGSGGAVILGVRDAAHIKDAIQARELRLTRDEMIKLQTVLDLGAQPVGDIWSVERG